MAEIIDRECSDGKHVFFAKTLVTESLCDQKKRFEGLSCACGEIHFKGEDYGEPIHSEECEGCH